MTGDLPTRSGDALIICTDQSFRIYAVGRVSSDGQQSFQGEQNVRYVSTYDGAVEVAKTLKVIGRRTFLLDLDSGKRRALSQRRQVVPGRRQEA
jgi:hypothetical protein